MVSNSSPGDMMTVDLEQTTTLLCKQSLQRVLAWARSQDYAGYSKFDVFNSPVMSALALNNRYLRLIFTAGWSRLSLNLRPWVATVRSRNPKALAYLPLPICVVIATGVMRLICKKL